MIILVINESIKKSNVKSRRIISKYLNQKGSATWCGPLSDTGLNLLVEELKKIRNKNTCVVFYRITRYSSMELLYIIGSHKHHDIDGNFVFKTNAPKPEVHKLSLQSTERIFKYILRISALLHDIGKSNLAFQQVIRGSHSIEEYRHEYLSFYMLLNACTKHAVFENGLDLQIEQFRHAVLATDALDALNPSNIILVNNSLDKIFYTDNIHPALKAILWLVLTHHRVIPAETEYKPNISAPRGYIRTDTDGVIVNDLDTFKIETECPEHIYNKNDSWITSFNSLMTGLNTLCSNHTFGDTSDIDAMWRNVAHFYRPLLNYADYTASITKPCFNDIQSQDYKDGLFANSNGSFLGDTLVEHLLKVRRSVDDYLHLIHFKNRYLDKVTELDLVDSPIRVDLPEDDKFHWQSANLNNIEPSSTPFFGIVIAGTGSGKTMFANKLLHKLNPEIRVTYAVGLRTLTFQVRDAYLNLMQFPPSKVGLSVGSLVYKKLMESTQTGSSNSLLSLDVSEFELNNMDADTLKILFTNDKDRKLINIPVLVCTSDYLAHIPENLSASDSKLALRVTNSDLILDELDNYHVDDLVSLGKLVYLYGLNLRRVIIMSATLRPEIVKIMWEAYHRGLKDASFRLGRNISYDACAFLNTDTNPCKQVLSTSDTTVPYTHYVNWLQSKLAQLDIASSNKTVNILDISGDKYKKFEQIVVKAKELHTKFYTEVPDGRFISTGLIKFNTVRNCREFSKYVVQKLIDIENKKIQVSDNWDNQTNVIAIICYHSRYPVCHLFAIETKLNKLFYRKVSLGENEVLSNYFNTYPNVKNLLILLATTNIEETGRDHDLDFSIMEPTSLRSVVQVAGRCRRHRYNRPSNLDNDFNIYILSECVTAENLLKSPGIRDKNGFDSIFTQPFPIHTPTMYQIPSTGIGTNIHNFYPSEWKIGLTNKVCLEPVTLGKNTGHLNVVEAYYTQYSLYINHINAPTLYNYLNNYKYTLDTYHSRKTKFRSSMPSMELYIESSQSGMLAIKELIEQDDKFTPHTYKYISSVSNDDFSQYKFDILKLDWLGLLKKYSNRPGLFKYGYLQVSVPKYNTNVCVSYSTFFGISNE